MDCDFFFFGPLLEHAEHADAVLVFVILRNELFRYEPETVSDRSLELFLMRMGALYRHQVIKSYSTANGNHSKHKKYQHAHIASLWASPAQRLWQVAKGSGLSPRNAGAVNSTTGYSRSSGSQDLPVGRRFMDAPYDGKRGVRTGLVRKLENPDAVKRSTGDQPFGRVEL